MTGQVISGSNLIKYLQNNAEKTKIFTQIKIKQRTDNKFTN